MRFIESKFSQKLSTVLSNDETLLLDKVVKAIYPAPAFHNIAHQLELLFSSLTALNKLDLPESFRDNNQELISLIEKVTSTDVYQTLHFDERHDQIKSNPLYGVMTEYPVASLYSFTFIPTINKHYEQILLSVLALIFWISFNGAPKTLAEKQAQDVRVFIEKNGNLKFNLELSSLDLLTFLDKWSSLLSRKGVNWKHQVNFEKHVKHLLNITHINKPRLIDINPVIDEFPRQRLSPNSNVTIRKRSYIPKKLAKEDIGEDNRISLTEVSVPFESYIDEEALDQNHIYGSQLALHELMQLSLRPLALLDYEVAMICNQITLSLKSSDSREVKSATIALLLLCTSKNYEYLEALPIYRNKPQDTSTDYICLKTQTWNRHDIRMPNAFTASNEQKEHLEQVEHLVPLPLPIILIDTLENFLSEKTNEHITVKTLFQEPNSEFSITSHIISLFSNELKIGRNITPARIRNLMFERVSKQESSTTASLLLANTEYATNTTHYYLSLSQQKMVWLYQNVLAKLGFEVNEIQVNSTLFCGSELSIQVHKTKLMIGEKYEQLMRTYRSIDDNSSLLDLIRVHNQISLYLTLIQLITTAHRARKEYGYSDYTIDEENGLICIADKQNFHDSSVRILPIADIVLESLKAYRIHCDKLSRLIKKYSSELTQHLLITSQNLSEYNQPLLYLINRDLSITPIGQKHIEEYLNEWNLPTNAFRHYFLSFMQNTGAKKVATNYMGHIRDGEHILSDNSLYCSDDILQMRYAINQLADSLGCQALNFSAKAGRRIPLEDIPKTGVYTPSYLTNEKKLNKTKLRHNVREMVEREYKNEHRFVTNIESTRDSIIAQIIEDTPSNTLELNYKLKTLDRLIAKILGSGNLTTISKTYADNEATRLSLQTDTLFKAKQAELISDAIQKWILSKKCNESISKNSADREFIKILLSLIIHASFSFEVNIEFIRALKSPVFKDGNILWLTWTDSKDKKQRIMIDSITTQLIINNPNYLKTKLKTPSEINKILTQYLHKDIKKLPIQHEIIGKKFIDINKLVTLLNKRFYFSHTGLSQSYLNRKQQTTLLHDEVFTRWLRNSPSYKTQLITKEDEEFKFQSLSPPNTVNDLDTSTKLGTEILRNIRTKLNKIKASSGHTSSKMLMDAVTTSWANAIKVDHNNNLQQLIEQSTTLSETTVAVLCWLYNTAGKPGKGRKTIAITTLCSYISKVAKPLIISATNLPFFSLNINELQELYIEVIASRKVTNKNEAAVVLRVFHNHIQDNFKIPPVSWLEIEPSIYSKVPQIRANIISYREYQEIIEYLKLSDDFSVDDRLINQTILTLCYRLGLRKTEAESLMAYDVDFKHGIIHIRTNRYNRVKSPKSNRRIPMYLFLSQDEIDNLKQLVERILYFNNQQTNVGIFSRPMDNSRLIDFTPHEMAISYAMKIITHDPNVSLHICRHSFANYLYLFVCRGTYHPSIEDELLRWCRESEDHTLFTQKLIDTLIGEHSSAQKILHAISMLMGHEEVSTTIKHYIHVLDIIVAAENEKRLDQTLEIKQLKWINKLSISHANHIAARFNETCRRHMAISYNLLKKFKTFAEVDVVRLDSKTSLNNTVLPENVKNSLLYSLSMIEQIIRAAEDGLSIESIASKIALSEVQTMQILEIVTQLKEKLAYDGIIVHSSDEKTEFYNNPKKALKTRKYISTPSYKKILERINQLTKDERISLIEIWKNNYSRIFTGYVISSKTNSDQFITLINKLKYQALVKNDNFILRDRAKKRSGNLFDIIDPTNGQGRNSINLKFDHALFLLTVNNIFENS